MKVLHNSSFSRRLIVAVMLCSWIVSTNHCALGLMKAGVEEHAPCHAAKSDHGTKTPADGICECCRAIKASLPGKAECKFDDTRFERCSYAAINEILLPAAESAAGIFLEHGPPRAESFAEMVLQRSLLSHAPPALG